MRAIRVLIVDDSAFIRYVLAKRLAEDPGLEVVDTAHDGLDALDKIARLQPDVVTLDIEMPRLNGLDTLRQIMDKMPRPVIMLSSLTQEGAKETMRALSLGAVDFIPKPSQSVDVQQVLGVLKDKIRSVAGLSGSRLRSLAAPKPKPPVRGKATVRPFDSADVVLVVGASTGGPRALERFVSDLPGALPVSMAIVQHMPRGFTASLAERLNDHSAFHIKEADASDSMRVGQGLLSPGDYHLCLQDGSGISLSQSPPINYVRPAVDVTFNTAARRYGSATVGVILTGMGHDGTQGARDIKRAGGLVVAEAESTCVVYGMPKSAIGAGVVDRVVPIDAMGQAVVEMVQMVRRSRSRVRAGR